jgi:beta-1,4-mannosyl-glycoprotein beta-1,4-N-acetylglucosaminyltransferase
MPQIYDCFAFFNELDLLEIRLNELDSVVDYFVLVEATRTFQKQPKPLYFEENKERFKAFEKKIIHIVVDHYPNFFTRFRMPTPMDYDNHQKNQIIQGLQNAQPDDIIIYSDLDEIPRAEKIIEYRDVPGTKVFQQLFCTYFINCICDEGPVEPCQLNRDGLHYWRGTVMAPYAEFKNTKEFRKRRDRQENGIVQIEEGGWHFTYLGGLESVRQKLLSFAHTKEDKYRLEHLNDDDELQKVLDSGQDLFGRNYHYQFVPLDERFPRYVQENRERFHHLIKKVEPD